MTVTLAPIRPILTIQDICDLLRMSESQFWALKKSGWFDQHGLLVPLQPTIDARTRYSGEPFVQWLSDKNQQRLFRAMLREVEASGAIAAVR